MAGEKTALRDVRQRLADAVGAQLVLQQRFGGDPPRVDERYEIEAILGRGGFGILCRARNLEQQRTVALRLFALGDDDDGVRAALHDAIALGRLDHPAIVGVYATDEGELVAAEQRLRCAFIELQLVEGIELPRWLRGQRSASEVLAVLVRAGRALAYAHRNGLLHRDFKPENVMIAGDGRPRVLDFGLAPLAPLATPNVRGTPGYMAPELMHGDPVAASDQYSFAVVVREALTGRHPSRVEAGTARVEAPVGGPALAQTLQAILDRATAAVPKDRFADLDALCDALERPDGKAARSKHSSGSLRPVARTAIVIAALGGLVGAAWLVKIAFDGDTSEGEAPPRARIEPNDR